MDSETISQTLIDQEGRIAALETERANQKRDLDEIKEKLDDLLHLKSKGMGALWLVSLLIGSGTLGLIAALLSFFHNRPHV